MCVGVGERERLRLRSCSELLEQVIHVAEKALLTLEAQLLHHTRETKTEKKANKQTNKQNKDTVQAGRQAATVPLCAGRGGDKQIESN